MKTEELSGVVSLDLTKSPQLPPNYTSVEKTAKAMVVNSEEDFAVAAHMIQGAAGAIATVEAFFEGDKNLAHRLHASICDKIRTITAPWRSVRPALEPKMKAYRQMKEQERQAAQRRAQAEATQLRLEAETKAREIQAEAQRQAQELRRQGEMKAAREAQENAKQEAATVVEQAQELAEVGMIFPGARPAGGPGESRPWLGEVTDMRTVCRAIGGTVDLERVATLLKISGFPAEDIEEIIKIIGLSIWTVALEYMTPVRGQGEQMRPLVVVDQAVLNHIAKRFGQEDIQIPGARGVRGLQLKFSAKGAVPVRNQDVIYEAEPADSW